MILFIDNKATIEINKFLDFVFVFLILFLVLIFSYDTDCHRNSVLGGSQHDRVFVIKSS
jgi:hypothetical protein